MKLALTCKLFRNVTETTGKLAVRVNTGNKMRKYCAASSSTDWPGDGTKLSENKLLMDGKANTAASQ